jgi:hypothetical protein
MRAIPSAHANNVTATRTPLADRSLNNAATPSKTSNPTKLHPIGKKERAKTPNKNPNTTAQKTRDPMSRIFYLLKMKFI